MFSHKKTSRCFVAGVSGIPRYHLRQSLFLPLGVTKCRATPPLVPIGYSCSTLHPYSNSCPPWILTLLCLRRRSLVFVPLGFAVKDPGDCQNVGRARPRRVSEPFEGACLILFVLACRLLTCLLLQFSLYCLNLEVTSE